MHKFSLTALLLLGALALFSCSGAVDPMPATGSQTFSKAVVSLTAPVFKHVPTRLPLWGGDLAEVYQVSGATDYTWNSGPGLSLLPHGVSGACTVIAVSKGTFTLQVRATNGSTVGPWTSVSVTVY